MVSCHPVFIKFMEISVRAAEAGTAGEETLMCADEIAVVAWSTDVLRNIADRCFYSMKHGMKTILSKERGHSFTSTDFQRLLG